ncbi:MAG: hypothetical protein II811_01825 [Spirochaetaceae bacterium]|nr:hypothetical protein [Spirochaetaceae bacterium]
MRKILSCVLSVFVSLAAFASGTEWQFGFTMPFQSGAWNSEDGMGSFTAVGYGGEVDFIHTTDFGLAWKMFAGGSGVATQSVVKDSGGASFLGGIGFGGKIVDSEKLTVFLTGDLGFNYTDVGYFKKDVGGSKTTDELALFNFVVGPTISATYHLASHFGVFAAGSLYYNIGTSDYENKIYDSDTTSVNYSANYAGLLFQPRVGISISY